MLYAYALKFLQSQGHTPEEVLWIQHGGGQCTWADFKAAMEITSTMTRLTTISKSLETIGGLSLNTIIPTNGILNGSTKQNL